VSWAIRERGFFSQRRHAVAANDIIEALLPVPDSIPHKSKSSALRSTEMETSVLFKPYIC
jgi:hypothetical protein